MPVTPVLSVPAIARPPATPHESVMHMITTFYGRADSPGTDWCAAVDAGLELGAALAPHVDEHPLALDPHLIIKTERDHAIRDAEARSAFGRWGVDAARAALSSAAVHPVGIDAVLVASRTGAAMPGLAQDLVKVLHLRRDVEILPGGMAGGLGGAHAITNAATYVRAHPAARVLIVTADFASPYLHRERELTGAQLSGAVLAACLLSDGAAAAVMSAEPDAAGFAIHGHRSHTQAITQDSADTARVPGPRLQARIATDPASLVRHAAPSMRQAMNDQGWGLAELAACALHTGTPKSVDATRDALDLTDHHVAPVREALRGGDAGAVVVMEALRLIGTDPRFRPASGARGLGAAVGPGYTASTTLAFTWTHLP